MVGWPGTTCMSHFWCGVLAILKQKAWQSIPITMHHYWRRDVQGVDSYLFFEFFFLKSSWTNWEKWEGNKLHWRESPLDFFFFFFSCTSGSSIGWNNYETWNSSSSVVGNYKIALFNYVVFYRRTFLTFVTGGKWKETRLFIISIIILIASKVYLEAIHFLRHVLICITFFFLVGKNCWSELVCGNRHKTRITAC